ncbi:HNH endonuclease [Paenibacillus sp. NRS-1782]
MINNGLWLRKDIHILVDRGYITINEGFRLRSVNG